MSTNILEQLKREGSVALWHDYRLGHANDLSGNGNDGTLINSPWFDRNGLNTTYLGSEAVQVAHSASINLQTLTVIGLIVSKRITQASTLPNMCSKFGAGLTGYTIRFRETIPNTVAIDASASPVWVPSTSHSGGGCFGFDIESGNANTSMYRNGVVEDVALTSSFTITNNTSPLYIANWPSLDRGFGRTLSAFLIFNKLLTATEHAQVYGQLMKTRLGVVA